MGIFFATWIALLALLLLVVKGWGDRQAKHAQQQHALELSMLRTQEQRHSRMISSHKRYG